SEVNEILTLGYYDWYNELTVLQSILTDKIYSKYTTYKKEIGEDPYSPD
ncbi:2005_t:CDS:1, partial [Gigaspora rosea]